MALMLQNSRCGLVASTSGRPAARPAVHSRMVRGKPFRAFSVQAVTATAPVKITIQGRRLQVTPAIQQYIEEKVTNAVKFYSGSIKKVDVTISARGGDTDTKGAKQQKVDVTIFTMRHGVVRVEDSEANLYASVDIVCDKVFRKLNKIKDKSLRKHKAGEAIKAEEEEYKEYVQNIVFETATASYDDEAALGLELQQPAAADALPEGIVRSKVLTLSEPISVDQAIDQMEAVGHDFFIFRERASDALQVVYKRENGGYGILIPQKGQ